MIELGSCPACGPLETRSAQRCPGRTADQISQCANRVLAHNTYSTQSPRRLQSHRPQNHCTKFGNYLTQLSSAGYTRRRLRNGSLSRDSTLRPSRSKSPSLRRGVSTIRFVKPAIIRSANRRPSSRSTSKRSSRSNNSSRYWRLRRSRSASAHASLSSSFGPSSHACRRFRSRSAQAAMSASDTAHGSLPVSESLSERRDSVGLLLMDSLQFNGQRIACLRNLSIRSGRGNADQKLGAMRKFR